MDDSSSSNILSILQKQSFVWRDFNSSSSKLDWVWWSKTQISKSKTLNLRWRVPTSWWASMRVSFFNSWRTYHRDWNERDEVKDEETDEVASLKDTHSKIFVFIFCEFTWSIIVYWKFLLSVYLCFIISIMIIYFIIFLRRLNKLSSIWLA